jgi:restriction system protein
MKCPRRNEGFYPSISKNEDDKWVHRGALEKQYDSYCSYCGSLNPDVFLELVEKGAQLVPTDKDYKAYIKYKGAEPKFYFMHLDENGIRKYIELSEKKKINFSYPGFFYQKPYFLLLDRVSPFAFGSVIQVEGKVDDGAVIKLIKPIYTKIIAEIKNDHNFIYSINPRIWEEIIAASYDNAGFDEVILTPSSGDFGRDVIAIKKGFGSIRFIDQMKAFNPSHVVTANDVRALLGVLQADQNATKAIFTTTSTFAPMIEHDKLIQPFLPYRLELIDKAKLIEKLLL